MSVNSGKFISILNLRKFDTKSFNFHNVLLSLDLLSSSNIRIPSSLESDVTVIDNICGAYNSYDKNSV